MYLSKVAVLLSLIQPSFIFVEGEIDGLLDLGFGFDNSTVYWEDQKTFQAKIKESTDPTFFYAWGEYSMPEHGGTHLDAPYHFWREGWKIAQIPLENLISPGLLVDMSEKVEGNRSFLLTDQHLAEYEQKHGKLDQNSKYIMLIKFGWSSKYSNRSDYLGIDLEDKNSTKRNFPGIGESAVNWILDKGNIVAVGVDVASVDSGSSTTYVAHKSFARKNLYNLENVDLATSKLPARGFYLIVMPLKSTYGSGAPVRIIASSESLKNSNST